MRDVHDEKPQNSSHDSRPNLSDEPTSRFGDPDSISYLYDQRGEFLLHSAIVEHIAEGVHLTRAEDGLFVYANPAFARMFGYETDELIGRHVSMINAPSERAPEEIVKEIVDCLDKTNAWRGEVLNIKKDGTTFWCWATVSTFYHPTFGRVWLSIHEDISSRKQNEDRLRAANQAAEAANRAKSAFLSRMSHEIRTPLNAIIGAAELLEEEAVSPQGRQLLGMLKQGGATLIALVNNVLELSAIESGRIASEQEECEPRAFLNGLVASLEPLAQKKGISLETSVDSALPARAIFDVVHLRQVLLNLLGNALKFTQAGVVSLRASLGAPTLLNLEVSDTGPGIPPELQAHLFDPYRSRFHSPLEGQESGLGLSICKAFVELMQGTLSLQSSNRGTTFSLSIPLRPAERVGSQVPELSGFLAHKRILIAEDDPFSARILRKLLLKLGVEEISIARNGQEAVELARRSEFQLMLFDKHMPVMDGLEAVRIIRAEEASSGRSPCHIVAVTADAFADDRRQCIEAGCDQFLPKPISRDALVAVFLELARGHGAG